MLAELRLMILSRYKTISIPSVTFNVRFASISQSSALPAGLPPLVCARASTVVCTQRLPVMLLKSTAAVAELMALRE